MIKVFKGTPVNDPNNVIVWEGKVTAEFENIQDARAFVSYQNAGLRYEAYKILDAGDTLEGIVGGQEGEG